LGARKSRLAYQATGGWFGTESQARNLSPVVKPPPLRNFGF